MACSDNDSVDVEERITPSDESNRRRVHRRTDRCPATTIDNREYSAVEQIADEHDWTEIQRARPRI